MIKLTPTVCIICGKLVNICWNTCMHNLHQSPQLCCGEVVMPRALLQEPRFLQHNSKRHQTLGENNRRHGAVVSGYEGNYLGGQS